MLQKKIKKRITHFATTFGWKSCVSSRFLFFQTLFVAFLSSIYCRPFQSISSCLNHINILSFLSHYYNVVFPLSLYCNFLSINTLSTSSYQYNEVFSPWIYCCLAPLDIVLFSSKNFPVIFLPSISCRLPAINPVAFVQSIQCRLPSINTMSSSFHQYRLIPCNFSPTWLP